MGKKVLKRKKSTMITGIISAVIILLVCVNMIANKIANNSTLELASSFKSVEKTSIIVPEKDNNGYWTFTTDKDLKVVQITDIHIGGGWMSADEDKKAINAVASMITAEKPDLVIATGDISFPIPFSAGTINNYYSADVFATLMETLGVYWVPLFGNHDNESYSLYSREDMSDFYSNEAFKYCLFQRGDDSIDGYGNSVINVKNSDGIITQSLFTIDSNAYPKGSFLGLTGGYDNVHQNQIDWYKTTCDKLCAENQTAIDTAYGDNVQLKTEATDKFGKVPSLIFMHIPPTEYANAWAEFKANGYKDTENVKYYYGTLGEDVCCPAEDDLFFEALLEKQSAQGVFCGHDHINTFSMDYKGIRLTYSPTIDYLAYSKIDKMGSQRGCTVITVKTDGSFDCVGENYYQDKYPSLNGFEKEQVEMQVLNADHK